MSRSTRSLASWSNVSACSTADALISRGIDTSSLLVGTDYDPRFLKSRLAMQRGVAFEAYLKRDDHSRLLDVLGEHIDVPRDMQIVHQSSEVSVEGRWDSTVKALELGKDMLIMSASIYCPATGGYLEADYLLILDGTVSIIEVKSWPMVDQKPSDPTACGKALDQAAIYAVSLSEAVQANVSRTAYLINPRNVGFDPVATSFDLSLRVRKTRRMFRVLSADDQRSNLPPTLVELVANLNTDADPDDRLRSMERILDEEAVHFDPATCSVSCGLVRLCHERAYQRGDVSLIGSTVRRDLPGISTFDDVDDLISGDGPDVADNVKRSILDAADLLTLVSGERG